MKKFNKRFIVILLTIILCLVSGIVIWAGDLIGSSTAPPGGGGGTKSDNINRSNVTAEGPALFMEVKVLDVQGSDKDAKLANARNQVLSMVSNKEGVYDGSSYGQRIFYLPLAQSTTFKKVLDGWHDSTNEHFKEEDNLEVSRWLDSLINGGFNGSNAKDYTYTGILNYFSSDYVTMYNECINGSGTQMPVVIWTVGMAYLYDNASGIDYYTPSDLATNMSAWGGTYGSYDSYAHDIGNACKWTGRKAWVLCFDYYGAPHKGYGSYSPYIFGGSAWAGTNYIVGDSGNYYARGFWTGTGEGGTPIPVDAGFHITGEPKDAEADITKPQKDVFTLHLSLGNELKEAVTSMASNASDTLVTATVNFYCNDNLNVNSTAPNQEGTPTNPNPVIEVLSAEHLQLVTKVNGNTATYTFQCKPDELLSLCNGGWKFKVAYDVNKKSGGDTKNLRHTLTATMSLNIPGHGSITCTVDSGRISGNTKSVDDANWKPGGVEHKSWSYSTKQDVTAYAEIVANAVGYRTGNSGLIDGVNNGALAADWNVGQGMPSTENLSVAVGGESFMTRNN